MEDITNKDRILHCRRYIAFLTNIIFLAVITGLIIANIHHYLRYNTLNGLQFMHLIIVAFIRLMFFITNQVLATDLRIIRRTIALTINLVLLALLVGVSISEDMGQFTLYQRVFVIFILVMLLGFSILSILGFRLALKRTKTTLSSPANEAAASQ